jgi:hypothetical protein
MKNKTLLVILSFICCTVIAKSQPLKFNSYASASATIYLDFDGEEVSNPGWNNGNTINCLPSGLTNTQIAEVFSRVAEDYRPFNINITTDVDVFNAAPIDKKMRVIVTPTSNWFANVGGVSYLGSFTWGDETPCFVFSDKLGPNNPKMVAECCAHESGHTLGLAHQSKYDDGCHLTATYNGGNGTGETAWAPIMGNSYYRNMSGWSNGPTPYGCSTSQDNLSIITSRNGFGYRTDDHGDEINNLPTVISVSNININGIISTSNDKDAFTFSLAHNSNFHLSAHPFSTGTENNGADLDIKLTLYDAEKNVVKVYTPANTMSVEIDTILNAGTYFMIVEGTGNGNTTDYGSLGSYTLSGLYNVLPVCNVILNGVTKNNIHQLNWTIDCNETISSIVLQSSADAVYFTNVNNVSTQHNFSYAPNRQTDLYYRLQVISLSGKTVYSPTILLKKPLHTKAFTVSTFVTNSISIIANGNFKYQLIDIAGNKIITGNGIGGFNNIDMQNKPAGTYILSLSGGGETKTEKIVKQ